MIGIALFRDYSIAEVVRHLDLALPAAEGRHRTVTNSVLVQTRSRLGLAALFVLTAAAWATAEADPCRGFAVFGVGARTLHVLDRPGNDAAFGRPGTGRGEAPAGYPQLRLVALLPLPSPLLAQLVVGSYRESEPTLAAPLWAQLPDHSLTVLDRRFAVYALFRGLSDPARDRHWLVRVRRGQTAMKWPVVRRRGRNDQLIELTRSQAARAEAAALPATLRVRAVR